MIGVTLREKHIEKWLLNVIDNLNCTNRKFVVPLFY